MDLLAIIASLLASLFGSQTITPTPSPAVLAQSQSAYEVRYFQATPDQQLHLYPNYKDQLGTRDLIQKNQCTAGINGGFYSESHVPLGWVVSDRVEISRSQKNQLFNGFLSRDSRGVASVSYAQPKADVVSGLQTGPILFYEGKTVDLSLTRDKQARRSIAAVTKNGSVVFLTYFRNNSVLDGPTLDELPELIAEFEQEHDMGIVSAVNLDGGSASAFYTKDFSLDEWQVIGSWWCVQA